MHRFKRAAALLLLAAMLLPACGALAAEEIIARELEQHLSVAHDTLRAEIDQWHYSYKKHDLRFFVVHVYADRPEQLLTAFAGEQYTRDAAEATSAIAARHDAVIAINGDYYNFKESGGLVIRNGVLYRDERTTRDLLLVMADGTFVPLPHGEYEAGSGESLVAQGAVQSFVFGPILVADGAAAELPEKYAISTRDTQREPRTAIGQAEDGHCVLIVADGRRSGWSDKGMTLQELQQVFVEQGCRTAYNLDGGGSATLVVEGERLNRTSGSRERDVSDIILFTD